MRISISLPDELVKELDEVLKNEGYQVRSEGISDALKEFVNHHKIK
jgi:CopG family nickel-responsive transcriptional regulator